MMDGVGGPGLGFGKRGIGMSMWEWKSWNGSEVDETAISYANPDDARKDFEEFLRTTPDPAFMAEKIIANEYLARIDRAAKPVA